MYRIGVWLMGGALALAALGLFFSDPSGKMPEKINLIRVALGLEVQMFKVSDSPTRYLVTVPASEWLLGCIVIALAGAALVVAARWRRTTRES
ncbi:hypothetical protein [Cupriavidus pampae]|uniref:Transmembrane protein n=1 Tax=Cupriavidus pampae TaxID=659251 RepID=A0ABN7XU22_9BURK|nr:hypothetical protein [Cupriavidus pampae]CAG9164499.1 hypothetical protein LMG32289_00842 [Cupriavidus pampae]